MSRSHGATVGARGPHALMSSTISAKPGGGNENSPFVAETLRAAPFRDAFLLGVICGKLGDSFHLIELIDEQCAMRYPRRTRLDMRAPPYGCCQQVANGSVGVHEVCPYGGGVFLRHCMSRDFLHVWAQYLALHSHYPQRQLTPNTSLQTPSNLPIGSKSCARSTQGA